MPQFNAQDLFEVCVLPEGRAGVNFLNWELSHRPITERQVAQPESYAGAGLYALCFDNRLIYIGSFLGTGHNGASFAGDVAKERWWAHIGAITARGSRVHIAKRTLELLRQSLGDADPMVQGFSLARCPDLLHKDSGNLAPLRRLKFAAANRAIFLIQNANPEHVLGRFCFIYVRIDELRNGIDPAGLKEHIESVEKVLIRRYAPVCNSTHVPRNALPINVDLAEVEPLLRAALFENY